MSVQATDDRLQTSPAGLTTVTSYHTTSDDIVIDESGQIVLQDRYTLSGSSAQPLNYGLQPAMTSPWAAQNPQTGYPAPEGQAIFPLPQHGSKPLGCSHMEDDFQSRPHRTTLDNFPTLQLQSNIHNAVDEPATPPRKRVSLACQRCRERKRKRSGDPGDGKPCSRCEEAGYSPCVFLPGNPQDTAAICYLVTPNSSANQHYDPSSSYLVGVEDDGSVVPSAYGFWPVKVEDYQFVTYGSWLVKVAGNQGDEFVTNSYDSQPSVPAQGNYTYAQDE